MRRTEAFHHQGRRASSLSRESLRNEPLIQEGSDPRLEDLSACLPQGRDAATGPEDELALENEQAAYDDSLFSDESWQSGFVPASADWPVYDSSEPNTADDERISSSKPRENHKADKKLKRKTSPFCFLLAAFSLTVILACAVFAANASRPQEAFDSKLAMMQGQRFFKGVTIDGMDVSGLTPIQLRAQAAADPGNAQPVSIDILIDNESYHLTNDHIRFERNLEAVMEEAWSIGRQGSITVINSRRTPFEARWRQALHTEKNGATFRTKISYSESAVESLANDLALHYNREPVNAVVASFDFTTRQFTVTQDVKGRRIEPKDISDAIKSALDSGAFQTSLKLSGKVLLPKVSSVDLNNSFARLSAFSTKTGTDQDRNSNIALAAMAISNKTLMPGETFSFNETTGQRTAQKGYKGAPAIQGGVLIDDVGGGVCQVSSTLFCAAAEADMAIVERSPHAWPVSYMDKGLDATVNWPNLDFKFKNNKDTPVFIIASYQNKTLTVEFYGMLSAPGESVRLETELINTSKPPSEPLYQQNPALPPNTQKELKQARDGYVVDTYRVYLRNGSEIRREKLFTSKYKEVQQVIEFN